MTAQEFADSAAGHFHAGAVYYVIQLVRCVQISFAVFAGVTVLRKTVLKHRVFLKGHYGVCLSLSCLQVK